MSDLVKLRGFLRRVRRFAPAAWRSLRRDARRALRSALRFPTLRHAADGVRRAWWRSDPAWPENWWQRLAPDDSAGWEAARRIRAEARARLVTDGPAVYTGRLQTRPAFRGVTLVDHALQDDIQDWICDVLGLDGYSTDSVHARITVELLTQQEPPAPPATGLDDGGEADD